ncbi:MAG: hypothetical protein ACREC0_03780 [Methylocella sp.]
MYNDKIEAWICAIDATLTIPDYVKWFAPVFIASYGNNARDKFKFVKNIVDDYAEKEGILPHILVNTAPPVVSEFLEKKGRPIGQMLYSPGTRPNRSFRLTSMQSYSKM